MNTKDTVTLLQMSHTLFNIKQGTAEEFGITSSIARDLYNFAIDKTEDQNIKLQAESARIVGYAKPKCIRYLKHRLNLPIN